LTPTRLLPLFAALGALACPALFRGEGIAAFSSTPTPLTAPPTPTATPTPDDPGRLERYRQSLVLVFGDPAAAAAASVRPAPLLDDAKWAFTQRWDDNLIDGLRVRDLLIKRHMHGTFYLNASDGWYGNETHYPFEGDPAKDLGKALMKGGNSVGGHTLTHGFVPDLNRQEMSWETLAVRIDREVNTQSPVDSFVFPFLEFRNRLEKEVVHDDMGAILLRDGYIHVADQYFNQAPSHPTGLLDTWLLPCDGQGDVDAEVKSLLKEDRQREKEPTMCLCMHAWPAKWGGPTFPSLDRIYRHWHGRSIWWYPNANDLAAYRYQALHGPLNGSVQGASLTVEVERFEPWDLGASVPLTLKVAGAGAEAPKAYADGKELKVWRGRDKTAWLVELPQAPGHGMPSAYEWHRNHSNVKTGLEEKGKGVLEGLASRLWADRDAVHLTLSNRGADLENLRILWRLPLGYRLQPEERVARLAKGESLERTCPLVPEGGALLRQGRFYGAVQADFMRGGKRQRLYSDVRASLEERDPSFPKGGFLVLGPLPGDRQDFDVIAFARKVMARTTPQPCESAFAGESPCWQEVRPEIADPLHPEIIPAGGMPAPRTYYTWDASLFYPNGHKLHYLLMSDVVSPVSRTATALLPKVGIRRMTLNGKKVPSDRLELNAGVNRLEILYTAHTADKDGQATFSERNYGPFLRLVGDDGKRLEDIEYREPAGWLKPQTAQDGQSEE